eukprot:Gb_18798 [translate_table: standard]
MESQGKNKKICLADIWREIQGLHNWKGLLNPINPILKQEIIKYGEFAEICYESFDCDRYSKYYGSCKYNRKKLFQQMGIHSCGYEITKYIYACTQVALPRFFVSSITPDTWSDDSTWIGFISVVKGKTEMARLGRRDIVVTWRGTETSLEWIEDLKDWLVPAGLDRKWNTNNNKPGHNQDQTVMVESGFLSVYTGKSKDSRYSHMSARELVITEIQRLLQEHSGEQISITLSGHSLGAALALLCAYDIGHMVTDVFPAIPVTVFTFGCPRVGNKSFVDRLQQLNVKVLRVVNVNDVVPRVPGIMLNERLSFMRFILDWLPWTYSHAGVQICVNNNVSPYLKPTCNLAYLHSLEVYLHLLDGYGGEGRPFCWGGRDPALVNKFCNVLMDELLIPPYWWQEANKGLVKNEEGRWVQRSREEDDVPCNFHSVHE